MERFSHLYDISFIFAFCDQNRPVPVSARIYFQLLSCGVPAKRKNRNEPTKQVHLGRIVAKCPLRSVSQRVATEPESAPARLCATPLLSSTSSVAIVRLFAARVLGFFLDV